MSGLSMVSLVLQVTAAVATVAGAKSIACRPHVYGNPKSLWVALTLWVLSVMPEDAGRRLDVASLGSRARPGLDRSCGHRASPSSWRGWPFAGLVLRRSSAIATLRRLEPTMNHREHGVETGDSEMLHFGDCLTTPSATHGGFWAQHVRVAWLPAPLAGVR